MLSRLAAIVVLSAAVATLLPEVRRGHGRASDGGAEVASTAGSLTLYRLVGGAVEQLEEGAVAKSGDRIQLAYDAGAHPHGVIFSVDGAGHVTLHFPRHEADATALPGARGVLRSSFVLDDAPGFERFYFVTSERPLEVREALRCRDKPAISLRKQPGAPSRLGVR